MNLLELFNYDPISGTLTWKNGQPAGTRNYGIRVSIAGKKRLATAIIWQIMTGGAPLSRVEHINGDRYDLRWTNLREGLATPGVLTQSELQSLIGYDPEEGSVTWEDGRLVGSFNTRSGLEYVSVHGKRYELCDLVWLYVYGELPVTTIIFKDGDALNYAIMNLVSMSGTTKQRRRRRSKHNGIYWCPTKQQWKVRVTHKDQVYHLGWYGEIGRARLARSMFKKDADYCALESRNNPDEWLAAFNNDPADWSVPYWGAIGERMGAAGEISYTVPD